VLASLGCITHYRHVNDYDTITQIPPDVDLDNVFYKKWGPLVDKLGFDWSLTTAAGLSVAVRDLAYQSAGFVEKIDPYWHHGSTVISGRSNARCRPPVRIRKRRAGLYPAFCDHQALAGAVPE